MAHSTPLPPPPRLKIDPPLLNSSNPWATDVDDLKALFKCPHTGAVTTRTSLLQGFNHDHYTHQYAFFDAASHATVNSQEKGHQDGNASLNSLGYSPYTLDEYLGFIKTVLSDLGLPESTSSEKPFIVSVTGTPQDVVQCYRAIATASSEVQVPLAMEINLSCPNIPGSPPPAYDAAALFVYLRLLIVEIERKDPGRAPRVPFGLKTPPYTHATQFEGLITALLRCTSGESVCPVSFITATNTLGSCMILQSGEGDAQSSPALPGFGIGGMAGAPLHPLALGNVVTIRHMLDDHHDQLGHIQIIGTGGVLDQAGFARMKTAGAYAVGVGTGLGLKGVQIFAGISG